MLLLQARLEQQFDAGEKVENGVLQTPGASGVGMFSGAPNVVECVVKQAECERNRHGSPNGAGNMPGSKTATRRWLRNRELGAEILGRARCRILVAVVEGDTHLSISKVNTP